MPTANSLATSVSRHTLRQLKFVIPGAAITYYLGLYNVFRTIVEKENDDAWGRSAALASLGLGLMTVLLFLYVLLVPLIRGIEPNFVSWRESGVLSKVIPVLTTTIILGWSLLSFTFGRYSDLGYIEGIIGASGVYALSFGLMGLIPAPKVHRS